MIKLNIDVTQLKKERFREVQLEGRTAKYCDLIIFETKAGKLLVKQDMSKEEREAGLQLPILGNATDFDSRQSKPSAPAPTGAPRRDDVPF